MQKKIKVLNLNLILFLLIVLLSINLTFSSNLNSQEYIKLKINNNIKFEIDKNQNTYIDFFYLTSSFFPKSYENVQYLNNFTTSNQNYQMINDSSNLNLKYTYTKDTLNKNNEIIEEYILESVAYTPQIKTKQKYPIENVNKENLKYLGYTNLIDIDDEIKAQASQLAQGEDDVYIIASKIAKWIREDINYDLKTALANPNQKSSQVFKSKAGVCKEISNLYVSMMRSLGIPTRLVTGYAYTESEELVDFLNSNWGGHAWSEVLIGDVWVPFDLTYNQYGYIDATHIIIDKSADLRTNLIGINASGREFNIVENSLKTSTEFKILDTKEKISNNENYNIILEGPKEIGFDSFGYITVKIENKKNYYQNLFLTISKVREVELIDNIKSMIILKPNEKKEIQFRYKLLELEKGSYYIIPFNIQNEQINLQFNVTVKEEYIKIREIALPQEEIQEKTYTNKNVEFSCKPKLGYPKNNINCSIKNTNNYEINNIDICLEETCQKINLKINEEKRVIFETINLLEVINYKYENQTYKYNVEMREPKLDYTKNINRTNLNINYNIINFQEGLNLNLYKNDILINSSNKEQDDLNLNLDIGENNITIKLELGENIYDTKQLKLNIIEEKINILKKLIEWFKALFS